MIIQVLLIIVAILTLASGITAFFGSNAKKRTTVFWFLLTAIGATIWSIAIAIFIGLGEGDYAKAPLIIALIYSAPLMLVLGLLGYNSWHSSLGRCLTIVGTVACAILSTCIFLSPELLYDGFVLKSGLGGNSVHLLATQPFHIIYLIYFLLIVGATVSFILDNIKREKRAGHRIQSKVILLVGLSLASGSALIFDLILPIFNYDLVWIGPLALACGNFGSYYQLIKERLTSVSTIWVRNFSYLLIAAFSSIIYLIIFYIIFIALFSGQEPSLQVIVLNFIMFLIIILAMPTIRELTSSILSTISIDKVDMGYVIKKLNQFAAGRKNYHELADFLAEHLHFTYLGFIIDGKVYSSDDLKIDKADIAAITKIPASKTIWQIPDEATQLILNKYNINAVAPLGSANHQILIGKPLGHQNLKKSDLADIETIINLVAAIL